MCVTQTKNMARIGAAAIAQRGVKYKIVENCVRINGRRIGCRNSNLIPTRPANSLNGNAGDTGVESEPAQPKSKTKVKLNFGLSPDFSVQLKVSLSELLSERLSQKLKWLSVFCVALLLFNVDKQNTDTKNWKLVYWTFSASGPEASFVFHNW